MPHRRFPNLLAARLALLIVPAPNAPPVRVHAGCRSRLWQLVTAGVFIPLSVYFQVPSAVQAGISWGTLLIFAPDLGWWLVLFSSLLFITGLLRSVLLVNTVRSQSHSHKEAHQWLRTPLSA